MTAHSQADLPKDRWDKCKFCGRIRKHLNGNQKGAPPTCSRQGCPGQHVNSGVPLTQEERDALN
jgi:hypothetical protein